ncbi:glycine receptor subunit alpha-4 isoform X1 [Ceratina calcarata]|uniref:Glycine receptor subunit alpha-4 isoform X1 n=1 Tax=Ceratina calcarata TaxID=156304 RepID=A0AAJ7WEP0_9HYME|nr:glycine receptor subunit alpha-4 isoform X1 [Ceratina calcarata]
MLEEIEEIRGQSGTLETSLDRKGRRGFSRVIGHRASHRIDRVDRARVEISLLSALSFPCPSCAFSFPLPVRPSHCPSIARITRSRGRYRGLVAKRTNIPPLSPPSFKRLLHRGICIHRMYIYIHVARVMYFESRCEFVLVAKHGDEGRSWPPASPATVSSFSEEICEPVLSTEVEAWHIKVDSLSSSTFRLSARKRGYRFFPKIERESDVEEYGRKEASLSLRDILPLNPKQYDKHRAPKFLGQPTIVYFHVTVLSLDSINEESMTYVADIFLAQSWRDSRLRLPENMSEEYRILDVDWLHNIWRPDCFFKNAKKVTFHEMSIPNHYLWLYHDKTLLYMSKLTLVLSCAMKFESYPHDTQICSMMIESLSHTTQDLVFIWNMTDPLVVNPEIELPQLDISNNYTTDCTIEYSTGNFTCIQIVFNLRRRLGYHLFHTYIPSALIVVMSWIAFWIKPEAIPARVTLGVTSLLTLATQNTQSQQSLPPVSYVKAIDVWMSSCSVFVFLSLMEFAVVNNYMGPVATKAMKGYSDEDLREAIDEFKTPMRNDSERSRSPVRPVTVQYDTCCQGRATAIYIDKVSRFFFPFSFLILNVVYWSTFL